MTSRLGAFWVACVICSTGAGCVLGPGSLKQSRTNYNRAVQQTARQEMLLNLVRMKYHQSEEFIRIPSITSQFTYDADLGGSGSWQEGAATKLGLAFGVGAQSKPTIVYTPEQAQEFNERLLSPINLETIDLLTSKGWAINRVLRLTVRNINDIDNATSAGGPTPALKPDFEEFHYFSGLLRELQQHGQQIEIAYAELAGSEPAKVVDAIPIEQMNLESIVAAKEKGYRLELSDDGTSHSLWTVPQPERALVLRVAPGAADSPQLKEICRVLELAPLSSQEQSAYRIQPDTFGQLRRPNGRRNSMSVGENDRNELVVSTRSMKEMMFYLSHGISIPQSHAENGRVRDTLDYDGCIFNWREMTGDLFRVNVQRMRPRDAAVAVKYDGYWFYIEETDLDSKSTFNLLLELFNLQIRAGGNAQIPLLTI